MKIGIPSYKRPECYTVKTLIKNGIDKKDIVVSVQTLEDYKNYKENLDVEIIYKEKDCAAGNRNTLIEYLGTPIILMGDDIVSFKKYEKFHYLTNTEIALNELIRFSEKENFDIIGISANDSNLIRNKRNCRFDFGQVIQGSFIVLNKTMYFDENFKVIDDYELCCRAIQNGYSVVRLNDYATEKKTKHKNFRRLF